MLFSSAKWVYMNEHGELPLSATSGHAFLVLAIGNRKAYISPEQKWIARGYRAVFLGPDFEPDFSVTIPPDSERPEETVATGCTDDPSVVTLTLEFMAAINAGAFAPQVIVAEQT